MVLTLRTFARVRKRGTPDVRHVRRDTPRHLAGPERSIGAPVEASARSAPAPE
jgi:hypothetical protein